MKKSLLAGVGLVALVALPAAPAQADTPWIHIRVEETKEQSKIKVNLPLSVVQVALEVAPEIIEEHTDIDLGDNEVQDREPPEDLAGAVGRRRRRAHDDGVREGEHQDPSAR